MTHPSPAIRSMWPGELDTACAVLGLAFADNPSTLFNAGGKHTRARRTLERAARTVKLGTPFSYVLVAEDHDAIVGVLNATPWPHCQLTPLQKLKTFPRMILAMGAALPRAARMAGARAKHDPPEPHWHVGPVGVHPDHQGCGIGHALLETFLDAADREAALTFLETDVDRNITLYERLGFVVSAQEEILGINTRLMTRRPPLRALSEGVKASGACSR